MIWPFGKSAKDHLIEAQAAEIAFLRNYVATMRSVVRDPSQEPERRRATDYSSVEGLKELARREAYFDSERDKPAVENESYRFSRNPVEDRQTEAEE